MWQIRQTIQDPPAEWEAAFTLRESPEAFELLVRISAGFPSSFNKQQITHFQNLTTSEFERYFDFRFFLNKDTSTPKPLRCHLDFVEGTTKADLLLQLLPGRGSTCLDRWYVDSQPLDWVHELGHQLGLVDEYPDPSVPHRAASSLSTVFSDDSLMANYKDPLGQIKPNVGLRQRHGDRIAVLLSQATLHTWQAFAPTQYRIQAGDTLTQIAQRFYREGDRWQDLYEHNRSLIRNRFRLPVGQLLNLLPGVL